jgi:hypothetical protein
MNNLNKDLIFNICSYLSLSDIFSFSCISLIIENYILDYIKIYYAFNSIVKISNIKYIDNQILFKIDNNPLIIANKLPLNPLRKLIINKNKWITQTNNQNFDLLVYNTIQSINNIRKRRKIFSCPFCRRILIGNKDKFSHLEEIHQIPHDMLWTSLVEKLNLSQFEIENIINSP